MTTYLVLLYQGGRIVSRAMMSAAQAFEVAFHVADMARSGELPDAGIVTVKLKCRKPKGLFSEN